MIENIFDSIKEMTIGQMAGNASLLLVAISAFIEITPIKINPLSAFFRWVGEKINGDLISRVEAQDKKIDSIRDTIDENEIDRIRWEILDFANSCRNGRLHTEDEFTHIIDLNQKYHRIIEAKGMTNGKIDLEYQYIVRVYKNCQDKNSFL